MYFYKNNSEERENVARGVIMSFFISIEYGISLLIEIKTGMSDAGFPCCSKRKERYFNGRERCNGEASGGLQ